MKFTFISGNRAWGGSEELWAATAAALAERGHSIAVFKSRVDPAEPRIRRLRELGADVRDLARIARAPITFFLGIQRLSYPLSYLHEAIALRLGLTTSKRPDLAIVSQGGNHDGELMAGGCRRMGIPYVLICQKATDLYWPPDSRIENIRQIYREAKTIYFVSEHNVRLTEEQLGMALPHARVVRNPFLVPWERRNDWPDESGGVRLACIGRLYPKEKGQDILLRVLARPRWRERPLSVTFYGEGLQREGLEQMARYLELESVTFAGFVRDIAAVWNDHHGLILPSRCEGLPLVLVEAMLSGRVPIVTDVAGSGEVVENGVTGFLAAAATEDAMDEAMERAWKRRAEWRAIGEVAADRIRTMIPREPEQELASLLQAIVEQQTR